MEQPIKNLNIFEAAELLKMNVQVLRDLSADGRIPAYKIAGLKGWRYREDEIVAWFNAQFEKET